MWEADVETIIRIRSGPQPSAFAAIARSTAFSRIVTAVSSTSPACFDTRALPRIPFRSSSASANCGIPFGLPRFVTSSRRYPARISSSRTQSLAAVGIHFSSCWKPSRTVMSARSTRFGRLQVVMLASSGRGPRGP